MSSPEILLEDVSPNGNIQAVVERNNNTLYFYLFGSDDVEFGMRSCWVRNLAPAPHDFDENAIKEGLPPALPARFCAEPAGADAPDPADLHILWFEEGDSAALMESQSVIAIIPPWSGTEGFAGYARDCVEQSPVCWPLPDADSSPIYERLENAWEFWQSWSEEGKWESLQKSYLEAVNAAFGEESNYYAIDDDQWPPKALLMFETDDYLLYVTIGVSIRPMPGVELFLEEPADSRRIELAFAIDKQLIAGHEEEVAEGVASLAEYPWSRLTWIGEGHSIGFPVIPPGPAGVSFDAILLSQNIPGAPEVHLPTIFGDKVNLLWLVPITDSELVYAQANTSEALVGKLQSGGHGWIHRDRKCVV